MNVNQNLETELHSAFCRQAAWIPAAAGDRLRAVDYNPRTGRLSPRLTVGALGGAVVTAGAVISVVVLGGAQPAFAGWSASPVPASGAAAATADAACQAKLAANPGPDGSTAVSGWNAVTTDVRGPFTVVIFQDGTSTATCFTGPSFTVLSQSSVNGRVASGSESVTGSGTGTGGGASSSSIMVGGSASGDISHMTVAHLDSTSNGPYTLVEGQTQPSVTGVTLVRSDGSDVQASTGGGWFVAWWPGSQDVTSALVTTPSGTTSEPLDAQPLPAPPLPSSAGGGSCSASSSSPLVCSGGGGAGVPSTATQGG